MKVKYREEIEENGRDRRKRRCFVEIQNQESLRGREREKRTENRIEEKRTKSLHPNNLSRHRSISRGERQKEVIKRNEKEIIQIILRCFIFTIVRDERSYEFFSLLVYENSQQNERITNKTSAKRKREREKRNQKQKAHFVLMIFVKNFFFL